MQETPKKRGFPQATFLIFHFSPTTLLGDPSPDISLPHTHIHTQTCSLHVGFGQRLGHSAGPQLIQLAKRTKTMPQSKKYFFPAFSEFQKIPKIRCTASPEVLYSPPLVFGKMHQKKVQPKRHIATVY